MSSPRRVRATQHDVVLAALDHDQAIALAIDGGYQVARLGFPDGHTGPRHLVVGRQGQAVALASVWSKDTALLTERMWPGPLTVRVPAQTPKSVGENGGNGIDRDIVALTMPTSRHLRTLLAQTGPLVVRPLRRPDGGPVLLSEDVEPHYGDGDIVLVVEGGACRVLGPTVVDCTFSPPTVCSVGALPESFVDAALMMGNRRRRWFTKRT